MASVAAGSQRAKNPSSASIRSTTVVASAAEWSRRRIAGPAASKRPITSRRNRWRDAALDRTAARSAMRTIRLRSTAARVKPAIAQAAAGACRVSAAPRMVATQAA